MSFSFQYWKDYLYDPGLWDLRSIDTRQLDVEDAAIAACRWPYGIDTVCTSLDLSDRARLYR